MTLPEVIIVAGIITVLIALVVPAAQRTRERSRALACKNNLRQLVLAAQAHESAQSSFPYTSTTWYDTSTNPPRRRLPISAQRYLMASLDQAAFSKIDFTDPTDPLWAASPPMPVGASQRQLQELRVPSLCCPSDSAPAGATSYRANLGISSEILTPSRTVESISQMGAFVNGRSIRASEFSDGLSHTAMFSERVVGNFDPSRYNPFRDFFASGANLRGTDLWIRDCAEHSSAKPPFEFSFAGGSWLLGGWLNTWYNHALPPNSRIPDCGLGPAMVDGGFMIVTARSLHPGAVHVAMADGSVRSVSESIDLQVWRAVGTRNGREFTSPE